MDWEKLELGPKIINALKKGRPIFPATEMRCNAVCVEFELNLLSQRELG